MNQTSNFYFGNNKFINLQLNIKIVIFILEIINLLIVFYIKTKYIKL